MYLENYYYFKSYYFIVDKMCKSKFIIYTLNELKIIISNSKKKKKRIISFLALNFMNISLINIKNNLTISLKGNYNVFSFFTTFILVWLPSFSLIKSVSYIEVYNLIKLTWKFKGLPHFSELESIISLHDNYIHFLKNFNLQLILFTKFDTYYHKEIFIRILKLPLII